MYSVDLHTHSIVSPDGSIGESDYEEALKRVDYIAITDHNEISFAQKMQKKFGENIIVGEEISTQKGDIIGLFLTEKISAGLSIKDAITAIHSQKGLVYIPHPFDFFRKGIGEKAVVEHLEDINIIEGFNGRLILRWQNTKAISFATMHQLPVGVGSDAHTRNALGLAYAQVDQPFRKDNAIRLLRKAALVTHYQPWSAFFAPKKNKMKKWLQG